MRWYLDVLKKYAVFSGRARRKEFWMFELFNLIVLALIMLVEVILGNAAAADSRDSILGTIYNLAVFIPSIAVSVRRMHDTGHSGWWILCPFVNLIFAVTAGTVGGNRFGPDPKAVPESV